MNHLDVLGGTQRDETTPNSTSVGEERGNPMSPGRPMTFPARRAIVVFCAVTLFFFLLTLVYHYPLLNSPRQTTFYGTHADVRLNLWALSWIYHAWSDETATVFDANIFYPHRHSLVYSESFIGQAVLGMPLFAVSKNVILVYNALIILTGFLTSVSVFLLVYYLTRSFMAGLFAGVAMASPPEHFAELSHLQSLHFFGVPLLLLGLVSFFRSGRNAWLLLVGGSAVLIVTTNLYFAVFSCLVAPLFVAIVLVVERRILTVNMIGKLARLLLTGGAVLLMLSPLISQYLQARQHISFTRDLSEIGKFSADLFDYAASSSWLYREATSSLMRTEGHFFGFTVVMLALFAVGGLFNARLRGIRGLMSVGLASLFTMLFCLVISFGPNLRIDGQNMVELPYGAVLTLFPPLSALRALSRMGMMTSFMLLVLASCGVAMIMGSSFMTKRTLVRRLVMFSLLITLIVETIPPIHLAPRESPGRPDEELVSFLAEQPAGSAVLHLPVWRFLPLNAVYQWWSTWHWQPLIFAQSGSYPPDIVDLADELQFFPSFRSVSQLQAVFPVSFIVVHEDLYDPASFARIDREMGAFHALVFVGKIGRQHIWRLERQGTGSHLTRLIPAHDKRTCEGVKADISLVRAHPAATYQLAIHDRVSGRQYEPITLRDGAHHPLELDFSAVSAEKTRKPTQLEFALQVSPKVPINLEVLSREEADTLPLRIEVHSAPFSGQGGQEATIIVNGCEWRTTSRGLAVALIDPGRAEILSRRVFDTHGDGNASRAFIEFVEGRPPTSIVVGAVCDDASAQFSVAADETLKGLGIDADVRGHYRHGFAFIAWHDGVNAGHDVVIEPGPVSLVRGPAADFFQFSLENWQLVAY